MNRCPPKILYVDRTQRFILAAGAQGSAGVREVYAQTLDPAVTLPSINFKAGYFPAHPTILSMRVFIP